MNRLKRRRWIAALGLFIVLLVSAFLVVPAGILWVVSQRQSPRQTIPTPLPSDWPDLSQLRLSTSDGEEIGAWESPGKTPGLTAILMHGHMADRKAIVDRAHMFADLGLAVVFLTARVHGDSSGNFNDLGWSARHDFSAAIDFVHKQRPEDRVILYGVSMGAVAAIYSTLTSSDSIAGLVLECPYQELLDSAIWRRAERYFPPGISHFLYLGGTLTGTLVLGEATRQSPRRALQALEHKSPILLFAGSKDWRAPVTDAEALAKSAGPNARVIVIDGADHHNIFPVGTLTIRSEVERLLKEVSSP